MHAHHDETVTFRWTPAFGRAFGVVAFLVVGFSVYANLSVFVSDPRDFRFFPPFRSGENHNDNAHLGAEYYSIATAITKGRGFSDPFKTETGPTAWMPPGLVWLLVGVRSIAGDDRETAAGFFVLMQDLAILFTGGVVLGVGRATTGRIWLPTALFALAICYYFRYCFQFTHDCFLVMGLLSALLAGMSLARPLEGTWRRAAGWGIVGGVCTLSSPIVAFSWGVLALAHGWQAGRRRNLAVALLLAGVVVAPWMIRNYLVFGRFIPVKSNLAYELFQSQCLQRDGLLRDFSTHPWLSDNFERQDYQRLGEMAFIDARRDLFLAAVERDPFDFADRVANRYFAATLWYTPFNARESRTQPVFFLVTRLVFPLPFLCLLFLLTTAPWRPLSSTHWIGIGLYLTYLTPYIVVSYYDRYKAPMIGVEMMLILWTLDRVLRWRSRVNELENPDDFVAEVVLDS